MRNQERTQTLLRFFLAGIYALSISACGGDDGEPSDQTDIEVDANDDVLPDSTDPACLGELFPAEGDICDCPDVQVDDNDDVCDRACTCEASGFWVCALDCIDPSGVALEWDVRPELVEIDGNGDRDVNPGERWAIEGNVRVEGSQDPIDVTVKATTGSARISFGDDDSVTLSDVGSDGVDFSLPFNVSNTANPGPVVVNVEAFDDGFLIISETLTIDIVDLDRPQLVWTPPTLSEVEGDGNTVVDPGETWRVTATLRNNGAAPAEGVSVMASPSSAALTIEDATVNVGILGGGAERDVEFVFVVSDDPSVLTPSIQLAATSTNAPTVTANLPTQIRPADTLTLSSSELRQVEGEGNDDEFADPGELWELVLTIENQGSFDVPDIVWSLINYEFVPFEDEEEEEEEDAEVEYVDQGFELQDDLPTVITAGSTITVAATATVGDSPELPGRVLVNLRSSLRQHGLIAVDIHFPRPDLDDDE